MNWQVRSRASNGDEFPIPSATAERAIGTMKEQRELGRDTWIEDSAGRRQTQITIEVSAELGAYIDAAATTLNKTINEWIADRLKLAGEEAWDTHQRHKAADAKRQDERDRKYYNLIDPPKRPEN